MPKRMLIDASHPEETRVVVVDGQRVEEFDFEAASKRPLKGNIYLAKVTRVEPSLQAAFVEYGGNRQGFLAFSEIHPDYYQIPVADRLALIAEQQEEARRRGDEEFEHIEMGTAPASDEELAADDEADEAAAAATAGITVEEDTEIQDEEAPGTSMHGKGTAGASHEDSPAREPDIQLLSEESEEGIVDEQTAAEGALAGAGEDQDGPATEATTQFVSEAVADQQAPSEPQHDAETRPAQSLRASRPPQRWMRRRHYKIQEVIKRRQVMLVQVVKEERGTKGAALTTYLSLAGRYCVLMPNTPRGGGISRKITNTADRNRLKAAAAALELPEGMGLIIRTAGANRTKLEIKRDYEYLLRLWDQIRELTLKSNAPSCVYEEGDIIKRAIRDLYGKDVSEVFVEGEDGYKNAKDFMRMLMPSHAKNVKLYRDPLPIFQRHHVEAQLDAMFTPTVTLKSGGYIVINQTEALVSIDVNSGRATREHSIEETAHKTNLEAAEEIARQLRLRDLAGLIVIDFIDMEDPRNDRDVERRLRDCVKNDRARVQIGKISQFGLLEMSRQRLRAGVVASSTIPCPHCGGQGIVRSVESTALRVLRALDEEGQRQRASAVAVHVANDVALYTLNHKRRELSRIESDYGVAVTFEPGADLMAGTFELERTAARTAPLPQKTPVSIETGEAAPTDISEPIAAATEIPEAEADDSAGAAENGGGQPQPATSGGKKRRRRRRRGRDHHRPATIQEGIPSAAAQAGERASISGATSDSDGMPDPVPQEEGERASERDNIPTHHQHHGAQGTTGSSRRRRRRRRKPRDGGQADHPHDTNGTRPDEPSAQTIRENHSRPEEESERDRIPAAAPNAPSDPVWSLTGETSDSVPGMRVPEPETANERESIYPVQREAEAPTLAIAGALETADPGNANTHNVDSQAGGEAPAQQQRRGWWQRQFRRS